MTRRVLKKARLLQSLGNHEFDDGPKGLEPFLRGVKQPFVAANVDISKSPDLKGITLPPSVVKEIAGRKVGIIGYLTEETSVSIHSAKTSRKRDTAFFIDARRLCVLAVFICSW